MQDGATPIGKDGKPINLHHVTQDEPGTLTEVSESTHKKHHKALHGAPPGSSFRNNPEKEKQFNNYRSNYWKKAHQGYRTMSKKFLVKRQKVALDIPQSARYNVP